MLDDTPEASLQNKFPDIGNAVAPAAFLSRRAMPSQHCCSESALGSKGYDQLIVGCQGLSSPLVRVTRKLFCTLGSHRMQGCNEHDAGFGVRFSVWCCPVWWCDQLPLLFKIRKVEMTRTCGQIAITDDASNCLHEINNGISFMYKW